MLYYENKFKRKGFDLIIGCDEVGRGALAGPVVASAVILRKRRFKNRITDSKMLSPFQRLKAYFEIIRNAHYGIGVINERIVDMLNIRQASSLAMENAVFDLLKLLKNKKISTGRIYILADGDLKLKINFPYKCIKSLDKKSLSCASASILAKVIRDRLMAIYDSIYPDYGFLNHKGYPTKTHILTLRRLGPSPIHRMTFAPLKTIPTS